MLLLGTVSYNGDVSGKTLGAVHIHLLERVLKEEVDSGA
jgi:hypothetical protein